MVDKIKESKMVNGQNPDSPSKGVDSKFVVIKSSPEIKERNKQVRDARAMSGKDFVVNMIEQIIHRQINNELTLKKDTLKFMFYDLGIENCQEDNAKAFYYLEMLKEQGRIEGHNYDGARYAITKPDIRKLQDYINDYNSLSGSSLKEIKKSGGISFEKEGEVGCLYFPGFENFVLKGMRAEIVHFMYKANNRSDWQTYEDIKNEVAGHSTMSIRKAIEKINKRFAKHTNGKYMQLIEAKEHPNGDQWVFRYRWNF